MNFSHPQAATLGELVEARDWQSIAVIDADDFRQHWPLFLDEYLVGARDNLDDLLTLGVVCGGHAALSFADVTIDWLEQQDSADAMEMAVNALAGCWHPQLYRDDLDAELLDRLLRHGSRLAADGSALPGFPALLQQIVSMPAAQRLSAEQLEQLAIACGEAGKQAP